MINIFLSYARADGSASAARLRAELERAGFIVWRDIEDMRGGQPWKDQLRAALRQVDVVLVLLTPKAVKSEHVTWEWQAALILEKRLIPLLIAPCAVPAELAGLHYHDFSQPDNYALAFAALIRDLVSGLRPTSPTPTQPAGPVFNVYGGSQNAIGTNPTVFNYGPVYDNTNITVQGSESLARTFGDLRRRVEEQPTSNQLEILETLDQAHAYAQQLQFNDQQPEIEQALEGRLTRLYRLATEVGEVALTTLINPVGGISLVIRKVAERAREQLK